jgi:CxxC motif-containing protein (DUF1111 family)
MRFIAILSTLLCLTACQNDKTSAPPLTQSEWQPGGEATVKRLQTRSYVYAGANFSSAQQLDFWTGFSLFRDPWVISPSSTADRDGLGPLFNTRSCISCHHGGGRSRMSKPGISQPSALVLRLGSTSQATPNQSTANQSTTDPNYGGQIQPRTISKDHLKGEAWLNLRYSMVDGHYSDGEKYQLQQPNYQLTHLSQGPLADNIALSPRYAPNVYGMGLLDAISNEDLLAQEDLNDTNKDGITAKYNRVLNVQNGQTEIGRFGLKAKQPNLRQQVAAAFRDDIGITNSLFGDESCTSEQTECTQLGKRGAPEIPDKLLKLVVDFNAFLGVPPARNLSNDTVSKGRELFYQSNCQACHTPSYRTDSDYPVAELANNTIWPYTDLALHDMGEGLADGVYEFSANGNEWRTPPLWGIGLQLRILGEQRYLHDGRARNLSEAILWHGGEAQNAKTQFVNLSRLERKQLISFLKAI